MAVSTHALYLIVWRIRQNHSMNDRREGVPPLPAKVRKGFRGRVKGTVINVDRIFGRSGDSARRDNRAVRSYGPAFREGTAFPSGSGAQGQEGAYWRLPLRRRAGRPTAGTVGEPH